MVTGQSQFVDMETNLLGDVPLMAWEKPNATDTKPEKKASPKPDPSAELEQGEDAEPDADNAAAEGEDIDEEADEETEDEEEVEAEAEKAPEPVLLEIDGEKVSLEDVRSSWLRQADYTRKTQALAEDRRKLETQADTERAKLREKLDQYTDRLKQLDAVISRDSDEPDWDKLATEDPKAFAVQFAAHQAKAKKRQAVQASIEAAEKERREDFETQVKRLRETEGAKLLEALPEWSKEETRQSFLNYVTTSYGYTADDIGQVLDHRVYVAFEKARRYDELQAKGKALLTEKTKTVKVLKPGTRDTRSAPAKSSAEIRKLEDRLRRTGSIDDAVALQQAQRQAGHFDKKRRAG